MHTRTLSLNLPQMLAAYSPQGRKWLEWGRGTGKSTILGWFIKELVTSMPRSKGALAGSSFKSMLGETLPSTVEGLERLGIYKDIHYTIGKRADRKFGWDEPFQPPLDWSNFIHFWTGAAIALVSQDKSSVERRGQNFDWVLGDEAAQLDEVRLFNEVLAGNRTRRPLFEGKPLFHAEIFCSTTPVTRAGLWFLKGEEAARRDPRRHVFISASARHNAMNLTPTWFEDMRRSAPSEMMYNAEVLNIRPSLTVQGYYPALGARHYYTAIDGDYYLQRAIAGKAHLVSRVADTDVDPELPLIFSFDPGSAINTCVVMQWDPRTRELRTLRSFWRLYPSLVTELVEHDVLPYYRQHKRKVVELFHDRTANSRQPNTRRTVAEDILHLCRQAGWLVNHRSAGARVITQDEKYHVLNKVLEEKDPKLPKVRINKDHNRDLIISLEHTEARENSKGLVVKDKSSEKRAGSVPRQHATDLGDAWDLPVFYYAKVCMSQSLGTEMSAPVIV